MQPREQDILKKLAEAREIQASAMSRFVQARGRVMRVETRLQALREHSISTPTPAAPAPGASQDAKLITRPLEIPKPEATPATPVLVPAVNFAPPAFEEDTSRAKLILRQVDSSQTDKVSRQDEQALPTGDEEEETQKVPAFRPGRASTPRHISEEETLLLSHDELARHEQELQEQASSQRHISEEETLLLSHDELARHEQELQEQASSQRHISEEETLIITHAELARKEQELQEQTSAASTQSTREDERAREPR